MTMKEKLSQLFEPNSVAVIGASATSGKPGQGVIRNILDNGYSGKLYLVNPKGGEILGMPVHSSISSLPVTSIGCEKSGGRAVARKLR